MFAIFILLHVLKAKNLKYAQFINVCWQILKKIMFIGKLTKIPIYWKFF